MTNLARLRQLATTDSSSDADLLDRFVASRDEPAFAALVSRHGPMVLAVCRRVLRHWQDAEDAFQATFLVLARRAETVKPRSRVGSWLHGVAYRTAHNARRAAAVRREREAQAAMRTGEATPDESLAAELREALDRELAALPDVYRTAVVACDLEGLHRRDAALRLGWTEGTLSSRLARARALLARRLARYGLVIPTGGVAAVAGPAAVAKALADLTVRVGTLVAAGEAVVAAPVAALVEGTMRTMLLVKLKALTAAVVVGCAVAVTALAGWRADAAGTAHPTQPNTPKEAEGPKRAAPNSDKERIAELEQERDRLLKQMAELELRYYKLERTNHANFVELNELHALVFPTRKPGPESRSDSIVTTPAAPALGRYEPTTSSVPVQARAVARMYSVDALVGDTKEGEALVKVVRAVVEPKSWGPDAGVEYLPSLKLLVVRQTEKVHDEVNELLVSMRSQDKPGKR